MYMKIINQVFIIQIMKYKIRKLIIIPFLGSFMKKALIKLFFLLLFFTFRLAKFPALTKHSLQVYGNASLGYYYVKIFVGHPPQEQSVIIDTGSGQLALPCNKCKQCNPRHIDQYFNMKKSKTAEYVTCNSNQIQCKKCQSKKPTEQCQFTISYAEGSSLQGVIVKDSIQFESFSEGEQIITTFGCTTRETNLFLKQQANGIFGLSPLRTSTLLEDLYHKHHGYSGEELQFSICLAGNGGLMTIGSVNYFVHLLEKSIKTTYSPHRNLYSINGVKNIRMGETNIHQQSQKLGTYGIFIDSGSTFTYFPRANYQIFKNSLLNSCNDNKQICQIAQGESTLCFHLRGEKELLEMVNQIFHPIIIQIGNDVVSWMPEKYFLLRDISNREVCLGVQALDRYLLGANWMVDRDIVFNLKEKTIEIFPEADCLGKSSPRRYMSQYTQRIAGNQPLTYGSAGHSIAKSMNSLFFAGILVVIMGFIGILYTLLKAVERGRLEPIRQTESQQNLPFRE